MSATRMGARRGAQAGSYGYVHDAIPDPLATEEQARRFNHADLPDLTADELDDDLCRTRWALAMRRLRPVERAWLRERVRRVAAELARRTHSRTWDFSALGRGGHG